MKFINKTHYINSMMSDQKQGIYFAPRDATFKEFIIGLLKLGKVNRKYRELLTDDKSMKIFGDAFTSESVDMRNNYQVLEQIGDLSGNKFIVNYMYKRFPQLFCAEGVKIVARLRINYGAKQSFSEIARKYGFWPYISATIDLRQRKMKPLLEDVFEAFLGAVEHIIDQRKRVGVGYAIVYDILTSIFDEMEISLRYEDLYDAKTRLKELFDLHGDTLGPLVYKEKKDDMITHSTVYRVAGGGYMQRPDGTYNKKRIVGGRYEEIGRGSAALKADAQQKASRYALLCLNRQGFKKNVPAIYKRFSNEGIDEEKEVVDINMLTRKWGGNINELQSTRQKTKYHNKYMSTPLAKYCSERNYSGVSSCMESGATPSIKDTDGMYPIDLLFINNNIDEKVVNGIMHCIAEKSNTSILCIHKQVFDLYCTQYTSDIFAHYKERIKIVTDNKE
jgi:dsRNA-specific ribonuclease